MAHSFIHLHNHSEFSILDGALKIKDLIETAYQNNMPAVALTDHGNIFGAVQFFKEAKSRGLKPILGCEVYVAPKSRFNKKAEDREETYHFHLLLLVQNEVGYRNLCHLITKSYLEGFYYRPRIDKELLAQYSQGLIGLSSCLKGEVAFLLDKGLEKEAREVASGYSSIFAKGNFFIEIQDHGLKPQKEVNPKLVRLARELHLPIVATNDVHYLHKDDAESHDVLLCIQTNKKVSDQNRIRFGSTEFYFKTGEEMAELFREIPEAIENTTKIASLCHFTLPSSGHFLPQFKVPEGASLEDFFEQVAWQGFEGRRKDLPLKKEKGQVSHSPEEYEERLRREIDLIKEMGFEGYFLIVWDLIRMAKSKNIPVGPGRGSAAGSLLAYCLGITDIDPLEYNLLFERFLNPERISLPDIDIDFCGRRREKVLEYVTQKYGQENVCQIITFGTMAARQSIRDVGRALEVPLPEVDRIAKMIPPFGPEATIEGALNNIPQLRELREKNVKIAHLLSVAQRLEGQVRHPSIHAAGIVITPKPLTEFMPLYQSVKGEITTQFPMEDIESIGLLKMDLLGLRNLTVIQDTIGLIEKDLNQKIDLRKISLEDKETFDLFKAGNTDGVFQFESPGMKDLLRKYRPENFRDLIALNALYRPGPLKSGMTDEFIKRKNHPDQIAYECPELEPILEETKGIIVYQEQVMQIATEVAGFTMAEADVLRKAMGKKVSEIMKAQKQRFLQGARKRGLSPAKATKIFAQIVEFAGYGFNKSHSAAYATLALQTAYLKAHYPVHFMAALLTSEAEKGATSQVVKYINECQEMGIEVLPPDINESDFNFTVSKGAIRFGLSAIKNVGEGTALSLIQAREENGKFSSLFDIFREVDSKVVNRKVIESLIKAGAFDSLGWRRSQCFHLVDRMIEYAHEIQKMKAAKQNLLFGSGQLEPPSIPFEVKEMREWDESLFLSYEKDAVGFYITGHPLAQFKNLRRLISHTMGELDDEKDFNNEVRLAGIIISVKPLKTRKDERMAAFILEDMTGRVEIVAFPDSYSKYYEYLHEDRLIWIKGRFLGGGESRRVQLLQVMPLAEAFQKQAKRMVLRIFLPGLEESIIKELKTVLEKHSGECPVIFELETPHSYRVLAQSVSVKGVLPSEELTKNIQNLLGEDSVFIEY
ncbi:MAG: DNA polymerase III subunit alpha [Candidatus Aminicenantales bacterium]